MRVMVMIKGTGADEGKITPSEEMFAQMGAYNQQLVDAGIMLDGGGLLPSANGAKVTFEGGTTSTVDGPFTEAKEVIAGYWMWQVKSIEEAVEWAKRCPHDAEFGATQILEIRQVAEPEDFGDAYTDEVRAHEENLSEQIKQRAGS